MLLEMPCLFAPLRRRTASASVRRATGGGAGRPEGVGRGQPGRPQPLPGSGAHYLKAPTYRAARYLEARTSRAARYLEARTSRAVRGAHLSRSSQAAAK